MQRKLTPLIFAELSHSDSNLLENSEPTHAPLTSQDVHAHGNGDGKPPKIPQRWDPSGGVSESLIGLGSGEFGGQATTLGFLLGIL